MTEHKFTAADYMDEAESAERGGAIQQAVALWERAAASCTDDELWQLCLRHIDRLRKLL